MITFIFTLTCLIELVLLSFCPLIMSQSNPPAPVPAPALAPALGSNSILSYLTSHSSSLSADSCGYGIYDLNGIVSSIDWTFDDGEENIYYFSPCSVVQNPICANSPNTVNSSICKVNVDSSVLSVSGNSFSSYEWKYNIINNFNFGPKYLSVDGDNCDGTSKITAEVYFYCSTSWGELDKTFYVSYQAANCVYWISAYADIICKEQILFESSTGISSSAGESSTKSSVESSILVSSSGVNQISSSAVVGHSFCGFSVYNFTTLGNNISSPDWVTVVGDDTYYLKPCGIVSNPACAAEPTTQYSSICKVSSGSNPVLVSSSDYSSYHWSFIGGVFPTLGAEYVTVPYCPSDSPKSTTVLFYCADPSRGENDGTFDVSYDSSTCTYYIYVYTNLVCEQSRLLMSSSASYVSSSPIPVIPKCGIGQYDLSSLSTLGPIIGYTNPPDVYSYSLSICSDDLCGLAGSSMICQAEIVPPQNYVDMLNYDPDSFHWSYNNNLESDGPGLYVQSTVYRCQPDITAEFYINFYCNNSYQQPDRSFDVVYEMNPIPPQRCIYYFTVYVYLICIQSSIPLSSTAIIEIGSSSPTGSSVSYESSSRVISESSSAEANSGGYGSSSSFEDYFLSSSSVYSIICGVDSSSDVSNICPADAADWGKSLTGYNYYFHPCGEITTADKCSNQQSMLCQEQLEITTINYQNHGVLAHFDDSNYVNLAKGDILSLQSYTWSYIDRTNKMNGIRGVTSTGDVCSESLNRTTMIDLICSSTSDKYIESIIVDDVECTTHLIAYSSALCQSNNNESSTSELPAWGWIIIGIVVAILCMLILCFGCNRYQNNKILKTSNDNETETYRRQPGQKQQQRVVKRNRTRGTNVGVSNNNSGYNVSPMPSSISDRSPLSSENRNSMKERLLTDDNNNDPEISSRNKPSVVSSIGSSSFDSSSDVMNII